MKAKESRPLRVDAVRRAGQAARFLDAAVRTVAEGLAEKFIWPGKDGKPLPVPPPFSAAQQETLRRTGKKGVCTICSTTYHHPIGYGVAGSGPPLVDSNWLRGSDERLIRMMLHGLRHPISINKEAYNKDGNSRCRRWAWHLTTRRSQAS